METGRSPTFVEKISYYVSNNVKPPVESEQKNHEQFNAMLSFFGHVPYSCQLPSG